VGPIKSDTNVQLWVPLKVTLMENLPCGPVWVVASSRYSVNLKGEGEGEREREGMSRDVVQPIRLRIMIFRNL